MGTGFVSIILVLLVILVMDRFYLQGEPAARRHSAVAAPLPTESDPVDPPPFVLPANEISMQAGITRLVQGHTILPAHPRWDVFQYTVQKGDTIFAIAEKFNLRPETILWGNYYILGDDPHRLMAGQQINILPVDGVYYEWHSGDGLNGVADFYGVSADAIVDFPGNHLTRESVGNYSFPNIPSGTWLVIPGGVREFVSWSAPRITREDPSVAKIFGPGYCGEVMDGPIGYGTFIWPSIEKYLSGYDYSPETNHLGIDIAGNIGNAIFAVDNGVVVYAGWNDFGYGNVVVIDHGNGWQSLYAHMDSYNVQCGTYVYQGDVIGVVGSTGNSSGPHLHFELRSDEYGKVNPWNFLTQ
ncbi:MAG: peptidoglycan DD-metalloendopeptidase family protein [Chloroflexi bacterium]|nr:peptidoglycan DD-metalloendopeptidase family protein [Chloroflexota bacterium]